MAISHTHYDTLNVSPSATQDEIKQAYRTLAKQFHPDRNQARSSQEVFKQINAAYSVLSDPLSRRSYDQQLRYTPSTSSPFPTRQERTEDAQEQYRKQRQAKQDSDEHIKQWLNRVYTPVNRLINHILKPFKSQIKELSADPFDDDLMEAFQAYLEGCRADLEKAQTLFKALPNPPIAAGAAAHLYYCLNQVGDALNELEFFSQNYDETYLHAGSEMFRIAEKLRRDAQAAIRNLK